MKYNKFIIICLLIFIYSNGENNNENFSKFLNIFYSDSAFQISRIQFPLKTYCNDNERTLKQDTICIFERSEWNMIKQIEQDSVKYEQKISIQKNIAKETTIGKTYGFYYELTFSNINGKWYLIHIYDKFM